MTNPGDSAQSAAPSRPVLAAPDQILGTFSRARSVSVGDAARGQVAGQVVKIVGRAGAGLTGALRAPLSGVECVWYRSIVVRELRETGSMAYRGTPLRPMNPIAPSDLPDYGTAHQVDVRGQQIGSDVSSSTAFVISDGESSIVIDPRISDIDTNVFGINTVIKREDSAPHVGNAEFRFGSFGPTEVHTEWIIPVGAQLLAVGTVGMPGSGRPELTARGDDIVLVSTKPEPQILSRNTTAAAGPHLPFAKPRNVALLIGGGVLIVAIVVVIVLITIAG
jgi:E3 Ubiquitin ligase